MTRCEENRMVVNEMTKRAKLTPTGTYEEMVAFQLGTIASMLTDISKSLSILADKAESKEEPILDKPHIKDDYYKGFKNGLRTAEWRYDKLRADVEALEEGITSYHNDRPWVFKDEVLGIIDKHKTESEEA